MIHYKRALLLQLLNVLTYVTLSHLLTSSYCNPRIFPLMQREAVGCESQHPPSYLLIKVTKVKGGTHITNPSRKQLGLAR